MALPAELEGKTAEEIAAHYQGIIQIQKHTYENALESLGTTEIEKPKPGEAQKPKPRTMTEFMANPDEVTRSIIAEQGVTREEFRAASLQVQESMIYMAKERAQKVLLAEANKSGDSFDWERIEPMLDELSKKCDPSTLTSIETWKMMYYYNRGTVTGAMVQDAVKKATMPAESVTPGGNRPDPKKPLSPQEEIVAEGLGITAETYRDGQAKMTAQKFPLTTDNRNRR